MSPIFYKIFKEFDQEVVAEDFYVVTEVHSTELTYFLELATRGKIFSDLEGHENIKKFEDALMTFGVTLSKLQLERCNLEGDDLGRVIEIDNCIQDSSDDVFGDQQQSKHISFLSIENTGVDIQQSDHNERESEETRFELANAAISYIETGLGESCESENQQSCDASMSAGPWIMPNELMTSNQEMFDTSMEDSNQMIHKSNLSGMVDFNVDDILSSVGIMPASSQDTSLGFYQGSAFGSVLQDNDMSDGSSFDVNTLNQTNMGNQLNVECFRDNLMNDTIDGQMDEGSQNIFIKNLPPGLEIVPIGPATSSEMISTNQMDNSLMHENLSMATMNNEQNANETTDDLFSLLSNTGTSSQKCLSLVLPSVQEFVHSTSSDNDQAEAVEPFPAVNDEMFIEDLFVNEATGNWMDKSQVEEMDRQYSVVILADNGIQNIMDHQENHDMPQMSMEIPQDSLSFDLQVNPIPKPKRAPRKRKLTQKTNEVKKATKRARKQTSDQKPIKQRKRKIGKSTFKNEVFPDLITMQNLPKKIGSTEFESKEQEDPDPEQTILEKKCPYCPNVFIDEDLLRYHIGKHEKEPDLNEFLCALCDGDNRFQTLEELKSHRFEVHLQKNFVCPDCNETFPGGEYENFKKHLSSHWFGKAKDPIKCVACGFTSAFKNNYEKHFSNWGPHHNGQCAACQEEFFTWEDHLNHVNTVHGGVFKYKCGLCDLVLNSVKQQVVHRYQEHHQIRAGIVNGSSAFQRSEKLKKARNYNKTECTTCGKLILTRHFEVHISLHNPIGSFPCPKCRKVYSHPKVLQEHLKHYHEEFPCQHCGVVLNERRKYNRHILSLHTPEHQKPYQCTLCDPPKGFHRKLNYDDHVNTHTNNRPHKCRFCDQTFCINPSRYKHEKKCHPDLMPKRMM